MNGDWDEDRVRNAVWNHVGEAQRRDGDLNALVDGVLDGLREDGFFAAREELEDTTIERVAKAITDHRFPGGTGPGIGGPHALEIAEAAIAAFCAAREDTERPEEER
jgi:hypothetical protein